MPFFATRKFSRFVSDPRYDHWNALKRVMRDLKDTSSYGIHSTRYPWVVDGYNDKKWIYDACGINVLSGYVLTLGGGAVSWTSCKHTILTWSTMET
jgi:hypothetical protein